MSKKIKTVAKTGAFVALVWTCVAIHFIKTRKNYDK
tara:strand:+ start:937 stop:1044 length:108 start_codon:yes stop_codon:yes gene_type:complete